MTERLKPFACRYAHRGLYNNGAGIPENSLAAFDRASRQQLGIELDVQLTKDGQVVVFHDDTVDRMCGGSGRVDSFTLAELREMRLWNTEERIPLFSEVLDLLKAGTPGPLLVELKTGPHNTELCEKTLALLRAYPKPWIMESFDPRIVNWFRKNAPDVVRGQLATSCAHYRKTYNALMSFVLSRCLLSGWNRPDFIAYNRNVPVPAHVRRLRRRGRLLLCWTTKNIEEDEKHFDGVIFETFP